MNAFPKSARLLKTSDFKFKSPNYFKTEGFKVVYTRKGSGRLGISLSKKVLKDAVSRNKIKRLLREAFRKNRSLLPTYDLHFIATSELTPIWKNVKLHDMVQIFENFKKGT